MRWSYAGVRRRQSKEHHEEVEPTLGIDVAIVNPEPAVTVPDGGERLMGVRLMRRRPHANELLEIKLAYGLRRGRLGCPALIEIGGWGRGLTYNIAYTWSKSLDEISAINLVNGNNNFIQNPQNIRADYGPSSFKQPNRLTASGSWDLPVGQGKRWSLGPANWVLGGWKASGIHTVDSSRSFTVYGYNGASLDEMGIYQDSRYDFELWHNAVGITGPTSEFRGPGFGFGLGPRQPLAGTYHSVERRIFFLTHSAGRRGGNQRP